MIESRTQDPADKLDYVIDWRDEDTPLPPGKVPALAPTETITTSVWAVYDIKWVTTTDLVMYPELEANDDTTATGWVSVDPAAQVTARGKDYYFTNHIVTSEGRRLSRSIKIKIREQ